MAALFLVSAGEAGLKPSFWTLFLLHLLRLISKVGVGFLLRTGTLVTFTSFLELYSMTDSVNTKPCYELASFLPSFFLNLSGVHLGDHLFVRSNY
jgi:hypothetical protein